MREDLKRFFIDKEMIKEENKIEEKHECNCDGDCGDNCKCHNDEIVDYSILCDDLINPMVISAEEPTLQAEIKYLEGARELTKISKGDLIDLYAYEDVFVPYMGQTLISLGFSLKLPKGYMAKLYPRSSTFKTWGLIQTNHVGIIDNSYCGNNDIYMYPVQCTMAKQTEKVMINGHKVTISGTWVKKGDRICQMEICEVPQTIEFNKVDDLQTEDRGGFGSTGTK